MTTSDLQAIVLREVGAGLDGLPDRVVAAVLDLVTPYIAQYWELWRWKQAIYPGLQLLYVKRQCLEILTGQLRDRLAISVAGASVPQNVLFDNLGKMRDACLAEITRVEGIAQASRPPAIAVMGSPLYMDRGGRIFNPCRPLRQAQFNDDRFFP